jgi:hypothetical protein
MLQIETLSHSNDSADIIYRHVHVGLARRDPILRGKPTRVTRTNSSAREMVSQILHSVSGPTLRNRACEGCYSGRERRNRTPLGKEQVSSTATRRHLAAPT